MLEKINFKNFKSFKELKDLIIKPITIFCGTNSSGKSTILQNILLLKQSLECRNPIDNLLFNGRFVRLGNFRNIIFKKNIKEDLVFDYSFKIDKTEKKGLFLLKNLLSKKNRIIPEAEYFLNYKISFTLSKEKKITKAKILIVDDEQTIRELLIRLLKPDYEITTVCDGQEAIKVLENDKRFDIILTDFKMPEMDGMELLRRSLDLIPDISVIIMTGFGSIEIATEAMKEGACDFIEKPFNFEKIINTIEKVLKERSPNSLFPQSIFIKEVEYSIKTILKDDILSESFINISFIKENVYNIKWKFSKPISIKEIRILYENLPKSSEGEELRTLLTIFLNSELRLEEIIRLKTINDIQEQNLPQTILKELKNFEGFNINNDYIQKTLNEMDKKIHISNLLKNSGLLDIEEETLSGNGNAEIRFFNLLPLLEVGDSNVEINELPIVYINLLLSKFHNSIEKIFSSYTYIGPLREEPSRRYIYDNEILEIGNSGENAAYVFFLNQNKYIKEHYFYNKENDCFEKHKNLKLRNILENWLNLMDIKNFKSELQNEIIYLTLDSNISEEVRVNIADVGFGLSQIFPIILESLRMPDSYTLILEQPEIHLHPKLQMRMADYFISLALSGKKVIVETHSDHIINRLVRRIIEDTKYNLKDLIAIYFITANEDGADIEPIVIDDNRGIVNWPEDFFDQSASEKEKIIRAIINKS